MKRSCRANVHLKMNFRLLLVSLLVGSLPGCGKPTDIDTTYGRRPGSRGAKSVNGTGVLSGMFRQAGHKVSTWHRLSPRINRYDVIIWAPDDFDVPGKKQRERLEKWLSDEPRRTLVYIGRDYDAAIAYWDKSLDHAPPQQAHEVARRRAIAKTNYDTDIDHSHMPDSEKTPWFTWQNDFPPRQVRSLAGPWSRNIDASKVDIQLRGRLVPPKKTRDIRFLLTSQDDVLVCQHNNISPNNSQLIVVSNGSFLLNLPLVNHEHRKLAGALIDECEKGSFPKGRSKQVVFLETGRYGAVVLDSDPNEGLTGMEALTIWPLNVIVLHIAFAGTLLCFAMFPIFGRPREIREASRSDLGKHIEALGAQLSRTKDQDYAAARLTHYQEKCQRDSGVSHIDSR